MLLSKGMCKEQFGWHLGNNSRLWKQLIRRRHFFSFLMVFGKTFWKQKRKKKKKKNFFL